MKTHQLAITIALLCAPATSLAASGTLSGTLQFTQLQENCGTGNNAKYPCSQYNTTRPVRSSQVELLRSSDSALLGSGFTDVNGNWTVAWTDSSTAGNVNITVRWLPHHASTRLRMRTSTGGAWAFWGGSYTGVNGGNTAVGNIHWGANTLANVWDGAVMMWENGLSASNRMLTYFGAVTPSGAGATQHVEIRTWVDDGTCTTGLAWGSLNRVCLPSSAWNMNQARVMHELGHIAEYVSNRDQWRRGVAGYNFNDPNTVDDAGWNPGSQEFYSVQFTEAVATAFASVAIYQQNASEPRTCVSASRCATNLEAVPSSCANDRRKELSAERYFWDVYDSNNDGETNQANVWEYADTIHALDPGAGDNQKDEVWDAAFSTIDDPEGRSTLDFMQVWKLWGTDSEAALTLNCTPSGGAPAVD